MSMSNAKMNFPRKFELLIRAFTLISSLFSISYGLRFNDVLLITTNRGSFRIDCRDPTVAYFPDPESCVMFYHCSYWSGLQHKSCGNLFFNPRDKICDWPWNVRRIRSDCTPPISIPPNVYQKPNPVVHNERHLYQTNFLSPKKQKTLSEWSNTQIKEKLVVKSSTEKTTTAPLVTTPKYQTLFMYLNDIPTYGHQPTSHLNLGIILNEKQTTNLSVLKKLVHRGQFEVKNFGTVAPSVLIMKDKPERKNVSTKIRNPISNQKNNENKIKEQKDQNSDIRNSGLVDIRHLKNTRQRHRYAVVVNPNHKRRKPLITFNTSLTSTTKASISTTAIVKSDQKSSIQIVRPLRPVFIAQVKLNKPNQTTNYVSKPLNGKPKKLFENITPTTILKTIVRTTPSRRSKIVDLPKNVLFREKDTNKDNKMVASIEIPKFLINNKHIKNDLKTNNEAKTLIRPRIHSKILSSKFFTTTLSGVIIKNDDKKGSNLSNAKSYQDFITLNTKEKNSIKIDKDIKETTISSEKTIATVSPKEPHVTRITVNYLRSTKGSSLKKQENNQNFRSTKKSLSNKRTSLRKHKFKHQNSTGNQSKIVPSINLTSKKKQIANNLNAQSKPTFYRETKVVTDSDSLKNNKTEEKNTASKTANNAYNRTIIEENKDEKNIETAKNNVSKIKIQENEFNILKFKESKHIVVKNYTTPKAIKIKATSIRSTFSSVQKINQHTTSLPLEIHDNKTRIDKKFNKIRIQPTTYFAQKASQYSTFLPPEIHNDKIKINENSDKIQIQPKTYFVQTTNKYSTSLPPEIHDDKTRIELNSKKIQIKPTTYAVHAVNQYSTTLSSKIHDNKIKVNKTSNKIPIQPKTYSVQTSSQYSTSLPLEIYTNKTKLDKNSNKIQIQPTTYTVQTVTQYSISSKIHKNKTRVDNKSNEIRIQTSNYSVQTNNMYSSSSHPEIDNTKSKVDDRSNSILFKINSRKRQPKLHIFTNNMTSNKITTLSENDTVTDDTLSNKSINLSISHKKDVPYLAAKEQGINTSNYTTPKHEIMSVEVSTLSTTTIQIKNSAQEIDHNKVKINHENFREIQHNIMEKNKISHMDLSNIQNKTKYNDLVNITTSKPVVERNRSRKNSTYDKLIQLMDIFNLEAMLSMPHENKTSEILAPMSPKTTTDDIPETTTITVPKVTQARNLTNILETEVHQTHTKSHADKKVHIIFAAKWKEPTTKMPPVKSENLTKFSASEISDIPNFIHLSNFTSSYRNESNPNSHKVVNGIKVINEAIKINSSIKSSKHKISNDKPIIKEKKDLNQSDIETNGSIHEVQIKKDKLIGNITKLITQENQEEKLNFKITNFHENRTDTTKLYLRTTETNPHEVINTNISDFNVENSNLEEIQPSIELETQKSPKENLKFMITKTKQKATETYQKTTESNNINVQGTNETKKESAAAAVSEQNKKLNKKSTKVETVLRTLSDKAPSVIYNKTIPTTEDDDTSRKKLQNSTKDVALHIAGTQRTQLPRPDHDEQTISQSSNNKNTQYNIETLLKKIPKNFETETTALSEDKDAHITRANEYKLYDITSNKESTEKITETRMNANATRNSLRKYRARRIRQRLQAKINRGEKDDDRVVMRHRLRANQFKFSKRFKSKAVIETTEPVVDKTHINIERALSKRKNLFEKTARSNVLPASAEKARNNLSLRCRLTRGQEC